MKSIIRTFEVNPLQVQMEQQQRRNKNQKTGMDSLRYESLQSKNISQKMENECRDVCDEKGNQWVINPRQKWHINMYATYRRNCNAHT